MVIEPAALATITGAVSVIGTEYLKGVATEAGKATWSAVKALFGWASDPDAAQIPEKVAAALTDSPALASTLLEILKRDVCATAMVGKIEATGGKVVVAQIITTQTFQM